MDERLAVELGHLRGRQRLARQESVQLDDARERTLLEKSLHDGGRHVRQRQQVLLDRGVGVDDGAFPHLPVQGRAKAEGNDHHGGGSNPH